MSHVHQPHSVHHLGLSRRSLMWLIAVLAVAAAITIILIVTIGSDDTSSSSSSTSSPTPVTQSGPNESLRGQSAAVAVGGSQVVQQDQSGPNETLRGQAVASPTP